MSGDTAVGVPAGAAGGEAPGAAGQAGPSGVAAAGFRILRELGVRRADTGVAPADVAGTLPGAARQRSAEVKPPSAATASAAPARPVLRPVQATRGVPYDARAVLGAAAAPPVIARAGPTVPDFVIFPVPSRHEAVVGVPLQPYPPLPVPRLHRELPDSD